MIKTAYAAGAVLASVALVGCGSASPKAAPGFVQELKAPPAHVPADYTTVAAITDQLEGVATCTANGPQSEICTLVTSSMNSGQIAVSAPFQVKVFGSAADTAAYLKFVHGANVTRANDGSAVRQALTGPHWVVTPQTDVADLAARLQPYLGGTITQ